MTRIVVIVLLAVSAHFSLTSFAPAPAGKASFYWPFAADTKAITAALGGLPRESGWVTAILAALAGLGFLAAAASLVFGAIIPADAWRAVVVAASAASVLLYALYLGRWSILPLLLDAIILWGIFAQAWSMAGLRGS